MKNCFKNWSQSSKLQLPPSNKMFCTVCCRRAMKSMGEPLSEAELDMMMADADANGDGKIDYEGTYTTACLFVLFKFALKTQVIRTVFSTRIPNSQSPLVTDNALNCSETHLPVYQSIQLIYQRESTFITA